MNDAKGVSANHHSDQQILGAKDLPGSTTLIVGFPMRATRDPDLSVDDLRVLICVGMLAGKSGWFARDTDRIAEHTSLPEPAVIGRLERLEAQGYLRRRRGAAMIALVPDPKAAAGSDQSPPRQRATAEPAQRGTGRLAQASLHSDMLRRPMRRQSGSIEFDDSSMLHPVVASLQDSVPGGIDGFRFWIRTILDPQDVEIFSSWASRQSAEYRDLIRKYDGADDDRAIESLLEDTLALVDQEKTPSR